MVEGTTEQWKDTLETGDGTSLLLTGALPGDRTVTVLGGQRLVLGRGADCHVTLDFSRVSRRHAEIYTQGPATALRDLHSTNGVFVDGRRSDHSVLRAGTLLRLGDWLGVVQAGVSEAEARAGFAELAPGLFGGPILARLLESIRRAVASRLPVVLVGETGTGKERFARAVHGLSGRSGPFHAVNCAALPAELAAAELFGFRKGAFTGADRSYGGHLQAAHDGTLFLDELGELPLAVQAKLLRAIESHEIVPLGDTRPVKYEAQIVAACQEPLDRLVERGRFRRDLAARLLGMTVELPPLRERRIDIPSLFLHCLDLHGRDPRQGVCSKLYESLCLYDWPENVRELEFLARRMLALHRDEPRFRNHHLPERIQRSIDRTSLFEGAASRREHEGRRLARALVETNGNVKQAAKVAGISRQRAYRLMGTKPQAAFRDAALNGERQSNENGSDG